MQARPFSASDDICQHIRIMPGWQAPDTQSRGITPLPNKPRVFWLPIDVLTYRDMQDGLHPDMVAGLGSGDFMWKQ